MMSSMLMMLSDWICSGRSGLMICAPNSPPPSSPLPKQRGKPMSSMPCVEHALGVSAEARIKDLPAQVEALRDALGGAAAAPLVVALPGGHLQAQLDRR
jgi:hypothetical protein